MTTLCALLACSCLAIAAVPKAAADLDIGVGDWWNYVYEVEEEGMTLDGDMKMKVKEKDSSGGTEVFEIEITGSGEMTMGLEGFFERSGDFSLSGTEKRLTSNYSFVSSTMAFTMTVEILGIPTTFEMGMETLATPSQDDYIGDDVLEGGAVVVSNCTISTEQWMEVGGEAEDPTEDEYETSTTMTVAAATQTVTVPAGTFECWKITVETKMYQGPFMYDTATSTVYYSEEVKNYVRMEGEGVYGGMFSMLELESYAGGGGGVASFLSDYWWVLALIVAVIVVVVLLVIVGRKGRRAPTSMPPPQQPAYQYQAPPGSPPPSSPPPSGPSG